MFNARGSLTISLTSRCRQRRSWHSRPFLFPGGTATTVDLARTILDRLDTEATVGGTCLVSTPRTRSTVLEIAAAPRSTLDRGAAHRSPARAASFWSERRIREGETLSTFFGLFSRLMALPDDMPRFRRERINARSMAIWLGAA